MGFRDFRETSPWLVMRYQRRPIFRSKRRQDGKTNFENVKHYHLQSVHFELPRSIDRANENYDQIYSKSAKMYKLCMLSAVKLHDKKTSGIKTQKSSRDLLRPRFLFKHGYRTLSIFVQGKRAIRIFFL